MSNDQYLELFLSEAQEILTSLNQHLLQLEKKPNDSKLFETIFRNCHTLKGNAAAMEFEPIMRIAHAMENSLGRLKKGEVNLNEDVINSLFEGLDHLESLITNLEQCGKIEIDEQVLLATLEKLNRTTELNQVPIASTKLEQLKDINLKQVNSTSKKSAALSNVKSVRINLHHIDALMNMVGELHINKTRLIELARIKQDEQLTKAINELNRIVNKLQDEAMQMRLLPLKYIFNYLPRMIRGDAQQEGKEIELTIIGAEIGVDRAILDEVNDPLIHLLRNAVSHGIEMPQERREKGKPEVGQIRINAHRDKNMVVLTISDDGRGINLEQLKAQLLKQGLMSLAELEKLSTEELLMLITLPGFSLSKEVTERSGRGVGMDVVKNKIEAIGGSFSISSELDKGTIFTLYLPVSMAIIKAMLVKLEQEICAIPLHNIIEIIKINASLVRHMAHQEIISYREEVIPLICLKEKLGFTREKIRLDNSNQALAVVICEINRNRIGLVVDELLGQQEIVTKNLSVLMQSTRGFSGATILGNGRVALIIDVASLLY